MKRGNARCARDMVTIMRGDWWSMPVLAMLGATAVATPTKPAPTRPATGSWADWVGSLQGALTWSSCSVAGAKTVTLALEITDGVAAIDLAPARPGMPSLTLVGDQAKDDKGRPLDSWSARQGDVAVEITRRTSDLRSIDLAVDLDSGCRVRGRLQRSTTGVAACDALAGWARIEARCTKLTSPPLEDLAKLLATKWKPTDGESCRTRAAKLEHALVDAGCAPHPDPQIGVRARACLELAQTADRLSRCSIPHHIKQPFIDQSRGIAAAAQTADRSTLPYVEQQCRDERSMLVAVALKFHCQI